MFKKYISLFLITLFSALSLAAQNGIPGRPNPPRLVNDLSGTDFLASDEEAALEQKLQAFANETSNQVVIVVVDDLGGLKPGTMQHNWASNGASVRVSLIMVW
jgi:uncharacterized protein